MFNPRQFFGPATIRHSPPRTVVTSAPNICCDYEFDQPLSVHPVLYFTLLFKRFKSEERPP